MIVFKGIHKMSARKWDLQFVRFAFAFGVVFLPGFSLCPLNQFIYKAKHNSQTNIPPAPSDAPPPQTLDTHCPWTFSRNLWNTLNSSH